MSKRRNSIRQKAANDIGQVSSGSKSSASESNLNALTAKYLDERQKNRINLYKSFADIIKAYPTLIAFATAGAYLERGTYRIFDYPSADQAVGHILYVLAIAGAFCTWAVFNDALLRFFVKKDSKKSIYLLFGAAISLCVTTVPIFAFQYVLTNNHWLVSPK